MDSFVSRHPRLATLLLLLCSVLYQFLADGPLRFFWLAAILLAITLVVMYGAWSPDFEEPVLGWLAIVWAATPIGMNLASIIALAAGWLAAADALHEYRYWALFWPVIAVIVAAIGTAVWKKLSDEHHWLRIRRRRRAY